MAEYLTPEEIAVKLGVTSKTVRDWLRTGDLIGIKVGNNWRIHPRDLARLLDDQLFKARIQRAERVYPNVEWKRGQCRECGSLMPEPATTNHWVCSTDCLINYDKKAESVLGRDDPNFFSCCGSVVHPY